MKQSYTYTEPVITSTASKMDLNAWDKSLELFDEKKYLQSFHTLLDYINPELRKKYGNKDGTEFKVPHGSIVVTIKIENEMIKVTAPFLKVSKENRIPLLRQISGLNMNIMLLAQIYLRGDELYFEHEFPLELAEPYKTYYILEDICYTGDRYDDEFVLKFKASRIHEPEIKPYDEATIDRIYNEIQKVCSECLQNLKDFEEDRKFGFAWNVVDTAILKVLYFATPQGQLLNDLNKIVVEMDRDENTPLPQIVADGKAFIEKLQKKSKDEVKKDLYFAEVFIPPKRRSSLPNIQENFKPTYDKAAEYYAGKDYMTASIMIINKFYQLYYYNNVQEDVNQIVAKALKESTALPFDKSAPILYNAMKKIMDGNLTISSKGFFSKLFSKG